MPVVLVGRLLVVRAARPDQLCAGGNRPLGRTLLVPLGVAALVFGTGWWPVAVAGAAIALVGVAAIMPAGTARLTRGTPAALGAMLLFAAGYFGADSLITVMLTDGYRTSLAQAAVVLGAAPLAWALTSLAVPRFMRSHGKERFPVIGLALTALGVAVLATTLLVTPSFGVAVGAWTVAGIGVGLAYPGLYILSTTVGTGRFTAVELATAVITAEALGGLLGRAVGGAISSVQTGSGLIAAYLIFAVLLAAGAVAATRTRVSAG